MKKILLLLFSVSILTSCEKDEVTSGTSPLVKCGTMHLTSDGGPFRYKVGTSLTAVDFYITNDTTFDIYENQLYRIYYKDTVIESIDSVWFNPGGNWPNDSLFMGIDTTYYYRVLEDHTGTGPQSFDHILPSTIFDR